MKITSAVLVILYVLFLLNGMDVFCEPRKGGNSDDKVYKKKKSKKTPVSSADGVAEQTYSPVGIQGHSTEVKGTDNCSDARNALVKVLEDEEQKKLKKKRRQKNIAIAVASLLSFVLLAVGASLGGVAYYNKKKKGTDEEPLIITKDEEGTEMKPTHKKESDGHSTKRPFTGDSEPFGDNKEVDSDSGGELPFFPK